MRAIRNSPTYISIHKSTTCIQQNPHERGTLLAEMRQSTEPTRSVVPHLSIGAIDQLTEIFPVNPDQLINWVPIDKWLLTYCPVLNITKSRDSCHGILGAESSN